MPPLRLATKRGDEWQLLDEFFVATSRREVSGFTTHFSPFAIVATPPSELLAVTEQEGMVFAVGGVQLTTSAPVTLKSFVVGPAAVSYVLDALDEPNVQVELSGLRPGAELNVYDGSYRSQQPLHVDPIGAASYVQVLDGGTHGVWLQRGGGTVYIDADCPGCDVTGADCGLIGTWESAQKTCRLDAATPVLDNIEIVSSYTTLDCQSVPIDLSNAQLGGPAVVIGADTTDVLIQNCVIVTDDTSVLVGPRSAGARILSSILTTTEPARATVHVLAASTGASVEECEIDGAEGILLDNTIAPAVLGNRLHVQRGVFALGVAQADIRDNSFEIASFIPLPLQRVGPIYIDLVLATAIWLQGSDSDVEGNTLRALDEPTEDVYSVGYYQAAGLASNRITGNRIQGFDTGLRMAAFTGDVVSHNMLFENTVALFDESPAANPPFTPLRTRVFLNDIYDNGSPQVAAEYDLDLWDGDSASPTYGRGNYWGHSCPLFGQPMPPLFFDAGGSDSNVSGVVDAHPFGVPVAAFDDVRQSGRRLEPTGCQDPDGDHFQEHEEFRGIDVFHRSTGVFVGHVDLPGYGADPDVPDVFLEVDYTDNPETTPNPAKLRPVIQVFAEHGVNLHVDLGTAAPGTDLGLGGGNAFPEVDVLNNGSPPGGLTHARLDDVKAANLDLARTNAFYWVVYAREVGTASALSTGQVNAGDSVVDVSEALAAPQNGVAAIGGDRFSYTRFVRSASDFWFEGIPTDPADPNAINSSFVPGTPVKIPYGASQGLGQGFFMSVGFGSSVPAGHEWEDTTFMHELGHALGLCHDGYVGCGRVEHNRKPNYPSIMNYNWTALFHCPNPSPRLGYSNGQVGNLDEHYLVEANGIAGLPHATGFFPSSSTGSPWCAIPGMPVNWDGLGAADDICIDCDVNRDELHEVLRDADDWSNLGFYDRTTFGYGPETFEPMILDDGLEEARQQRAIVPIPVVLKPGSGGAPVNLKSRGVVPVALLATDYFDPADIDASMVSFGRNGDEVKARRCALEQVDNDGLPDMVCHFAIQGSGLDSESLFVNLRVDVPGGFLFGAIAEIRIVP